MSEKLGMMTAFRSLLASLFSICRLLLEIFPEQTKDYTYNYFEPNEH
jgi:hypothetical protein